MKTFNQVKDKYYGLLSQYVPVVERVHGKSHPEFYKVKELFDKISLKLNDSKDNQLDLKEEFKQLSLVTNNYQIPSDTCETYAAVYNMLSELDQAYQESK